MRPRDRRRGSAVLWKVFQAAMLPTVLLLLPGLRWWIV